MLCGTLTSSIVLKSTLVSTSIPVQHPIYILNVKRVFMRTVKTTEVIKLHLLMVDAKPGRFGNCIYNMNKSSSTTNNNNE